ncbi:MAG: hypothetical protein Q8R48_00810, partial [Candidatus Omnitrophota bacterium]|nr:hypothetical protein [Candidatus Omnitrophota bacterium]
KLTTIFEGSDLKSLISIIKEITERLREETVNGVDVSDLDKEIARLGSLAARQSSSGVGIDVDWPSFARAIDGDTWKRMPEVISTMTTKTGLWENFVDGGKLMLGWMNLSEWREKDNIMPPMREFAAQVRAEKKEGKTTDIVFVGQGGSIEGIKTLYRILGADKDSAAVHTMDTVDNEVISDLKKLPLETTRFVILSKSMTTMEVHSFYKLFYDLYVAKGIQNAKNHFTLVTDQEKAEVKNGVLTVSEKVREPFRTEALTRGFYNVFYIEPCSGGRYSWDTAIGILPALIMGQDVDKILEGARNVEELVKNTDLRENPMAQYGAFKYGMHQKGRNRPTLMLPDEIMPYGPWDGQLDTESVGKTSAQSSLTIDHEKPAEDLRVYTDKRFFVRIKLGHRDFRLDSKVADLEKAGFPVYTITLTNSAPGNVNPKDLGALLKMSEFATVIAGYLMGETTEKVNPVNQPGVEEYKKASQLYIAESYVENPKFVAVTKTGNVKLDYRASVENKGKITQKSLNEILKRLGRTAKNDVAARYAALLYLSAKKHRRDYNAMMIFKRLSLNPELGRILDEWRYGVRDTLWVDTLGEEAPCILHAKQQGFQKGEPSGNFTVVRFAKYKGEDIVIPGSEETYGQPKTFEDLIKALAIGALEALSNAVEIDENNREVPVNRLGVMIELKDETPETVAEFGKIVNETIALLSELVKRDQGNQAIIDHMVANEVMEGTGLGRFSASGHVTMLAERYRPALSSLIERMSGHVVELLKTDVNDTRGSITIKSEDIAFPAVFEYSIVGENIVVNYLGIQEDILVPILSYIANVHSVNSLLVRDAMPYHDEGEYISHLAQKDYMGYPGYNEKLKGTDTLFTGKLISLITSAPESTQPARARSSASGQTIDEAAEAIANLLIDSENRDNVRGAVAILNDTKELPGFEKETFLALVTSKVEKKTAGNVPNDLAAFTSYVNDTPGRFSASGKAVEFEPVKLLNAEEISAVTAEDIEALESTLLSLGTNKEALAKDGKVMIIWDTAISDTATNAVAQQTAKLIDKRLGEGAAINIRGNGTNSAKLLGEVQKYLGSENIRAIITIAGDKTLKADAPMGGTVEEALQKLHERSKVLNVQSKDAEGNPLFIQVPALYNLALSIGYEMPQDKIIQCLQNIGIVIDDNGKPIDPMSILTEKIVRILPRIRPVDMNADAEAQTLARKAVEHSV